jgi:dephospho-CoA kinase
MLKVGLTGGYATGKSFVAHVLGELGCHIIYADALGHEVLLPAGEAYASALAEFGPGILDDNGEIDRKKLADIVFGNPERLNTLSSFVHPAVFRLEEIMFAEISASDPKGISVLVAAILIEAKRDGWFDKIILTACDEAVQIARGIKRDNLTREQVLARLANQMPLAEKRKYADYVIDTSGAKEDTLRQIEEVYHELARLARERAR